MIRLQNYTPEVYYKQSRDFQFIGRLFDIVLNYVKTNADMIYDVPASDAAGSKMIDLLALTLGFNARHNYSVKQLAALCSVLSKVLHNKGNIQALQIASTAILNAEGVEDPVVIFEDIDDPFNIILYIPQSLSDTTLLQDLLDYILPAGITCDIIRATYRKIEAQTEIESFDSIVAYLPNALPILQSFDNNPAQISKLGLDPDFDTPNDKAKIGLFTNSTIIGATNDTNNSFLEQDKQ